MENKSARITGYTAGTDISLLDIPKEKIRLKPHQEMILNARVKNLALIQNNSEELTEKFNDLLPKICIITGMSMPEGQMAELTKAEIISFLLDFGYKLLNEDEVMLAFRINAQGNARFSDGSYLTPISPIGEYLNVFYCGRVLSNYMILRNTFDSEIRNIMNGY
jgi:hypothetical protein